MKLILFYITICIIGIGFVIISEYSAEPFENDPQSNRNGFAINNSNKPSNQLKKDPITKQNKTKVVPLNGSKTTSKPKNTIKNTAPNTKPSNNEIKNIDPKTFKDLNSEKRKELFNKRRIQVLKQREENRQKSSANIQAKMDDWRKKALENVFNKNDKKKEPNDENAQGDDDNNISKNDDEDKPENDSEKKKDKNVVFSATFFDQNSNAVSSVQIYRVTNKINRASLESSTLEQLPQLLDSQHLGISNEEGFISFQTKESDELTFLVAVYDKKVELVYSDRITSANAWQNESIQLKNVEPTLLVIKGKVSDRWLRPVEGALISNQFNSEYDDHSNHISDEKYIFTYTNKLGEYILKIPEELSQLKVSCLIKGITSQSIDIDIDAGTTLVENKNFFFKEAGEEPATWVAHFKNKNTNEILSNILVRTDKLDNIETALSQEDSFYSDGEGNAKIINIEPGKPIQLYLYNYDLGILMLEEHTFEGSETYNSEHLLEIECDKPAEIAFRLQDSGGIDITSGWITNIPIHSHEDFTRFKDDVSFKGAAIIPSKLTWIKGIKAREEITFYYCDAEFIEADLGQFTLECGEKRIKPIMRIKDSLIKKNDFSGTIVSTIGEPIEGLNVLAVYSDGTNVGAKTDDNGVFTLEELEENRPLKIFAYQGKETLDLHQSIVLTESSTGGETYTWRIGKDFTITVKGDGEAIAYASVSLSAPSIDLQHQTTNKNGSVVFKNIDPELKYLLKITTKNALFHPYSNSQFSPEVKFVNEEFIPQPSNIELSPREGVRIQLVGPTWLSDLEAEVLAENEGDDGEIQETTEFNIDPESYGINLRAWVGISNGTSIHPDTQPGNEYSGKSDNGELIFLTPPKQQFWIYIGGLPEPWGNKLHGPFDPNSKDIIEIELEEVEATSISLQTEDAGTWNYSIYHLIKQTSESSQLIGEQIHQPLTRSTHLGSNHYKLQVQATGFETYNEEFSVSSSNIVKLEPTLKKILPTSYGGHVKSFVVSDRFDLVLSEKNHHHGELCYGFNKDLLAHLGGEASFQATHLGEYPSASDNTQLITWRNVNVDRFGRCDFKSALKISDYSVAYAQIRVFSDTKRKVTLAFSSDDGIKAWVNSNLILNNHLPRAISIGSSQGKSYAKDQDYADAEFVSGWNQINIKVDNSWGLWALAMRILDPNTKDPITDMRLNPDSGYTDVIDVEVEEESASTEKGEPVEVTSTDQQDN